MSYPSSVVAARSLNCVLTGKRQRKAKLRTAEAATRPKQANTGNSRPNPNAPTRIATDCPATASQRRPMSVLSRSRRAWRPRPSSPRASTPTRQRSASFDLFVGLGSPELHLPDIAPESVAVDLAPGAVAVADVDNDARLEGRRRFRRLGRARIDLRVLALLARRHQRGASSGEQRMQNPTLDAFRIAHTPPDFEFGGDFDRKTSPLVHPLCRMVFRRTLSQIDPIRLQAGETRQRQLGDPPDPTGNRQSRRQRPGGHDR